MRMSELRHGGEILFVLTETTTRPRAVSKLSAAELEVVEALLSGETRSEIATRRGVAMRTILNQIASVYRKLGVRSASELARALRGEDEER